MNLMSPAMRRQMLYNLSAHVKERLGPSKGLRSYTKLVRR